ncbi:ATP-binding cassette domain-containing protein [Thermoactinomyces sp. DSM 45892]|uniref:ATP-binding cassette domain-containing protein n=1 Tax=Thermoactinomyces sp. DSM 45892 TaxID=1882753 RepID=UPI0008992B1A|nr:ABC transporter ATP-binding protein [Thermoactinomyces sp. DSM 45892]SDY93104.1 ABC-2 type transport system ATP-binding protein [Thermoactinomyces sp. DSM 45892]
MLLTTHQLEKTYPNREIGPINLSVEPGIISGLVGPNASGKSTILQMVSGAEHRDSGQITIFGKPIAELQQSEKRIAYVPSHYQASPYWTGNDLISWYHHWYPKWNQNQMQQLVKQFDFELHIPYEKLSTGNKRKLLISLAMSTESDLLLLDEPSNGLDFLSKTALYESIQNWMENSERSILLASHDVDEINKLMDHITLIHLGKQVRSFEKDEELGQWAYVWISNQTAISPPEEVVTTIPSSMTQWITQDLSKTRSILELKQIDYRYNVMQMNEILEWMYKTIQTNMIAK